MLLLFALAAIWLVGGGLLAVLASVKLHAPGAWAECPWLGYGRLQPAAWNAFIYGFAAQASIGAALWLTARLSGTVLLGGRAIVLGTLFWNLGLKLGMWSLLSGLSTGLEGLEMPVYAIVTMLAGYLLIAAWAIITFSQRRVKEVFVSQWYVTAALFVFPWVLAAGTMMGVAIPLRGILQSSVQVWFIQNLYVLWLGFIGLAILYYLLPKLADQPVPSRNLALFGFWTLALFGGLGGMARYQGGPFPAWMISLGVVALVMSMFPIIAVALNLRGLRPTPSSSPAVARLARWSLFAYIAAGGMSALNAFGAVRRITQFTLVTPALDQLFLLGFVAPALWALLYHVVPQLTGRSWPWARLVSVHAGLAMSGSALLVAAYGFGGWRQGVALNNPEVPFPSVVSGAVPFIGMGTLAYTLLWVGALLFAGNLAAMLGGLLVECVTRQSGGQTSSRRAEVGA